MRKIILVLTLATSVATVSCFGAVVSTVSPDKELSVVIHAQDGKEFGEASFSVIYHGQTLLKDAGLGLVTDKDSLISNLRLESVSRSEKIKDDYVMITGKRSHCINHGNQRVYKFVSSNGRILNIIFRVYDDGVAFRYVLNAINDENIVDEFTSYPIPVGLKRWMQQYDTSYEGFYPMSTDGRSNSFKNRNRWGYPALVEFKNSVFMLITESDIQRGHCASLLSNAGGNDVYKVTLGSNQAVSGDWQSPWRVLITGHLSDIVESTLVTDVASSARYSSEWVKPGLVSWIYWANNHGSRDYQIIQDYIDLAADMHWPYDLVDWEWDQMSNGGDIDTALDYARLKKVKLLLWYNSSTSWIGQGAPGPLYRLNDPVTREKELQWLVDKGFAGMKIDFFPGDDAATMDYYIDLMESAAAHGLMVNFHGATVPRGWQRTYPNMMSVEGVYGAEWYNNGPVMTDRAASHNATLPFTRNVIGPMDYTPGTFSDSQHPHITTDAHELALTVLFESALQHMPDRPSVYRGLNPRLNGLLSDIPTTWDDTHFISGYPGEYVVIARRKGNVWYIAGINGTDSEKTLSVDLDFINKKYLSVTMVTDGDGDRDLRCSNGLNAEISTLKCRPRGGFLICIK